VICPGCGADCILTTTACECCGSPLPQQSTTISTSADSAIGVAVAQEPVSKPDKAIVDEAPGPYPSFILSFLVFIAACSAGVFLLTQWWAVKSQGARNWGIGLICIGAAIVPTFLRLKWNDLASIPETKQKVKKLGITCVWIALIFPIIAGCFGWRLGVERVKFVTLFKDWKQLSAVGDRIADARNHVGPEFADYVAMYNQISADVREFREVTARLRVELEAYEDDYPEYSADAQRSLKDVQVAEQRGNLLQQQVDIAAKLSGQDEKRKFTIWQLEMQPVLEREEKLNEAN
jgi:hypothetical protein